MPDAPPLGVPIDHSERFARLEDMLDDHHLRIGALEVAAARTEGKIDTVDAKLNAHTAILGSQTAQLDRLLDEHSAVRTVKATEEEKRRTAWITRVLAVLGTLATIALTALQARSC